MQLRAFSKPYIYKVSHISELVFLHTSKGRAIKMSIPRENSWPPILPLIMMKFHYVDEIFEIEIFDNCQKLKFSSL